MIRASIKVYGGRRRFQYLDEHGATYGNDELKSLLLSDGEILVERESFQFSVNAWSGAEKRVVEHLCSITGATPAQIKILNSGRKPKIIKK